MVQNRAGAGRLAARLRRAAGWPVIAVFVVLPGPLLLLALAVAPNNWDSMTYHLSRVEHWKAQALVEAYATNIDRQLWLAPFSEFSDLHLMLLAGNDRLVGLVQLSALVVAAVAASVVAQRLGLGARGQFVSAIVVLTTPMAVSQSVTTQNDLLTGAYVMTAVAWLADVVSGRSRERALRAAGVGAAVALATLTKTTAVVFLMPFFLLWAFRGRRSPRGLATQAGIIGLAALALATPHLIRTAEVFDSPFGLGRETTANQRYGVDVTIENIVRNGAHNVGTPVSKINEWTTTVITDSMASVGLDANDPDATFGGQGFSVDFALHEDLTSNLVQFALVWLVAIAIATTGAFRRRFGAYGLCVLGSFVLFSALFSWQPWGNRLLLPLFLLMSVPIGALLASLPRKFYLTWVALLVVGVLPWSLSSSLRPLVPVGRQETPSVLDLDRNQEYFIARPELEQPYQQATGKLSELDARDVGLVQGIDSWEYPLWVLLRDQGSPARLRDVQVSNASRALESRRTPQALLCSVPCRVPAGWLIVKYGSVTVAWPPPRS